MSANSPQPIVLTGRVYVHGPITDDFPANETPAECKAGDLRLHSHLDAAGAERRRLGQSKDGYSGVIRASVYDGKQWHTFMLALEAASETRHFTKLIYRAARVRQILGILPRLKGFTCELRGRCYAVNRQVPPQTPLAATQPVKKNSTKTSAPAPAPTAAVSPTAKAAAQITPGAPGAESKAQGEQPASTAAHAGCSCMTGVQISTGPKRRRKRKSAPNQRELF